LRSRRNLAGVSVQRCRGRPMGLDTPVGCHVLTSFDQEFAGLLATFAKRRQRACSTTRTQHSTVYQHMANLLYVVKSTEHLLKSRQCSLDTILLQAHRRGKGRIVTQESDPLMFFFNCAWLPYAVCIEERFVRPPLPPWGVRPL